MHTLQLGYEEYLKKAQRITGRVADAIVQNKPVKTKSREKPFGIRDTFHVLVRNTDDLNLKWTMHQVKNIVI